MTTEEIFDAGVNQAIQQARNESESTGNNASQDEEDNNDVQDQETGVGNAGPACFEPECGNRIIEDPLIPESPNLPAPPGVDLQQNIEEANTRLNPFWFRDQVKTGGPWDFKQLDPQKFEEFGNFHFGAVGRGFGWPLSILLREAGLAHERAGSGGGEGQPYTRPFPWTGEAPFGDDPYDQYWIQRGYFYADEYLRQDQ